MSKLIQIQNLQQILIELRAFITELDNSISVLKSVVDKGDFIPNGLNKSIREKLVRIEERQKTFANQYESMGFATIPNSIREASDFLYCYEKQAESKEKYLEAVKFFLRLYSKDEQVQAVIQKRKKEVISFDIEKMNENDLQSMVEEYVLLHDAYYEEDSKKKFSFIYRLSSIFEEEIVMGIQFKSLLLLDEMQSSENVISELRSIVDDKNQKTNEVKTMSVDILESNEKECKEVSKAKILKSDDAWGVLKIYNPEAIIVKENITLLDVQESAKATVKFGVKEFKNEITKQLSAEKIDCLVTAFEDYGYSNDGLCLWKLKEKGYFDFATEKLIQAGYIKKYSVAEVGEFYTLTVRGEKAFSTRDSLSFINSHSSKRLSKQKVGEYIEDTANSAITRLLSHKTYSKTLLINPMYKFYSKTNYLGSNFYTIAFPKVIGDNTVLFFGVVSENVEDFKEAYEYLEKMNDCIEYLIVIGINVTVARATGEWVKRILGEDIQVWYCDYKNDEFYDTVNCNVIDMKEYIGSIGQEILEEESIVEDESLDEEDGVILEGKETSLKVKGSNSVEEILSPDVSIDEVVEIACTIEDVVKNKFEDPKVGLSPVNMISEEEKNEYNKTYQEMIISQKFYAAVAYVKVLSKKIPYYEEVYSQLAYALNDPMCGCSYNSDTIFSVYYSGAPVSDYYIIAAAMRNYFLDQFSYDYSLQQLHTILLGNTVLRNKPVLERVIYSLYKFKKENHKGLDRYADYREKERAIWEKRLEDIRREAKEYYDNYSIGNMKENASHKRFLETSKLIFGVGSELSEYLKVVSKDEREMVDLLEEFLTENYIKENAAICSENVDTTKINAILDYYWGLASQSVRVVKKTSDLVSSLRMNLYKKVNKIISVLCNYVFLIKSTVISADDPGLIEYKKIRTSLLKDIDEVINSFEKDSETTLEEKSGRMVVLETLHELKLRLEGDYKDGSYKYFYIDFLRNDKVLLDDDFLPVLDDVLELPNFLIEKRIVQHCQEEVNDWPDRLVDIFNGGDDYGSAELILKYLNNQSIEINNIEIGTLSIQKAVVFPQKDMVNKRREFIEDLELAQSYGQIDNTVENSKETMIQIMETWYSWALTTRNYGFFAKILEAFKEKIREVAQTRTEELEGNLKVFLDENPNCNDDEIVREAISQIKHRIAQQNYAAAEDLLNRLITNDLDFNIDLHQEDYLSEFLDEYDTNLRKTANSGATLKSLVNLSKNNKDTKGASRLLENWPKGAGTGENTIRSLMNALGFNTDTVKIESLIQGKIESYLVTLKRPQNGRKSNYKHPISAFGSEAELKGFRVVCIFGKSDATRLIDTFKEIGNAKNTIVLLDYALTLADRKTLARKTKTDLSGKIFAIIDRVALVYLAKHYTETAVNRMLMSIIMPFASYQPYIDKSANVMPQEIFIGRKTELEKIESPTGVNIVYGGRQLGKTALLRMAKKDIDMDENGDRAIIVNAWRKDYRETAKAISIALYDEKILKRENITDDWNELARDIKNRLRDDTEPIPYFLLMIDEADVFIESCESIGYQPFDALKDIQSIGAGRFKFVVAGLRNIVRFKRTAALSNNSVLTHLESLTVKPFKSLEARELLEVPLSYLGFRFTKDNETEVLISTIFGTTNYFPGLIQLYCAKLIEAVQRDYAGYTESDTPPYYVQKELIKKVLAEQSLQQDIREKFFITLKVDEDDYYYLIALLVAYHYHENKLQNGCSARDLIEISDSLSIEKITRLEEEKVTALMEEMRELNVLQHTGDGRYRFTRHSFCQMMGTNQQIDDELLKYMED